MQTEIWGGADYKSRCKKVKWVSPYMVYYKEAWKTMFVLQNLTANTSNTYFTASGYIAYKHTSRKKYMKMDIVVVNLAGASNWLSIRVTIGQISQLM